MCFGVGAWVQGLWFGEWAEGVRLRIDVLEYVYFPKEKTQT